MNKDLYGQRFRIDEKLKNHLSKCFSRASGANKRTEGYKRNQDLRNMEDISYSQLKRIKNWFDSYSGDRNSYEYILNGDDYMKEWVNSKLGSERNDLRHSKKIKMDGGMDNQFIQPHEKNNMSNINRPTQRHSKTVQKYDTAVLESLKRINELMKKII